MKVKEIMSKEPACCIRETSLQDVAILMVENDCGEIPVVDNTQVGIRVVVPERGYDVINAAAAGPENEPDQAGGRAEAGMHDVCRHRARPRFRHRSIHRGPRCRVPFDPESNDKHT